MSNLSDLLPAGAGGKQVDFVASGSLTAGQAVAIKTNGSIESISASNYTNFVGVTDAAISDTETGSVTIQGGVATNLTGLTPGLTYYVKTDGSLSAETFYIANAVLEARLSTKTVNDEPQDVAFNDDGTRMYLLGADVDYICQYSLSTAFDLSTAFYLQQKFRVDAQDTFARGIAFSADGAKMFMTGVATNNVFEYDLRTPFDVISAVYNSVSFYPGSIGQTKSLTFNNDGTKMYVVGTSTVYQYSLTTGFDLSTASYDSVSFAATTQDSAIEGVEFNSDGTKMYLAGTANNSVYQYSLSTAFDLSTTSYDSVSYPTAPQGSAPNGLAFSSDGTKMYITSDTANNDVGANHTIYQYATVPGVLAGKALSSTSLNLSNDE